MAILLALVTAAVYGIADFSGGLATRRAPVLHVVAGAHVIGGAAVIAASFVVAEHFDAADMALGALGGAFGLVGIVLLYRRLAIGPMSVVAPLTALTAAVAPAVWGLSRGEQLGPLGLVGIACGLAAVVLVSLPGDGAGDQAPVTVQVVAESLASGIGFGVLFIFLDATSAEAAPWPVAGARIFTSTLLVAALLGASRRASHDRIPRSRSLLGLIALTGLADTLANVTFLFATTLEPGRLAVVSVLSALYPVSTVILARVILGERMTSAQGLGFGAALAATILLSLG